MGPYSIFNILVLAVSLCIINAEAYTQGQLNTFSNLANGFIKENIVGRKLSDINFKNGYLRDIRITGITLPRISVKQDSNELKLSLSGAGLSARSRYRLKWSWIYRESGTLSASASGVDLSIPISLRSSSFLKVDASRCRDSIGRIRYKAKGGLIGRLANLLKGIVQGQLRRKLRGEICKAVTKAINKNAYKLRRVLGQ